MLPISSFSQTTLDNESTDMRCVGAFFLILLSSTTSYANDACSADFNGDGKVDIVDFLLFTNHFGSTTGDTLYAEVYDIDSNGVIGISDFTVFVSHYGKILSSDDCLEVEVTPDSTTTETDSTRVFVPVDTTMTDTTTTEVRPQFTMEIRYERAQLEDEHKDILTEVADLVSKIIVGDLPDVDFSVDAFEIDHTFFGTFYTDENVDDLLLFVTTYRASDNTLGRAGPAYLRAEGSQLPVIGIAGFNTRYLSGLRKAEFYRLALHEVFHALGFGTVWDDKNLVHCDNTGCSFTGTQAIGAFNTAGGIQYAGKKVPIAISSNGGWNGHWNPIVFGQEIMTPVNRNYGVLSAISIASLQDLGYVVDITVADDYTLPYYASKPVYGFYKCELIFPISKVDSIGKIIQYPR